MLARLKIKMRLTVGFSVVILLSIIIAIIALMGTQDSKNRFNHMIDGPIANITELKDTRIQVNTMARYIRDMALTSDTSSYTQRGNKIISMETQLKKTLQNIVENYTVGDSLATDYKTKIENWCVIAERIVQEIENGNKQKAITMIENECTPALNDAVTTANLLDQSLSAQKGEMVQKDDRAIVNSIVYVIILLIICVILSLILEIRITRSIVNPLYEVREAAILMSQGNLKGVIEYESKDSVGILAEAVRSSIHTLSLYINDIDTVLSEMSEGNFDVKLSQNFLGDFKHIEESINSMTKHISDTLIQINQSAEQVSNDSEQVSSDAQSLAHGTTQQAHSIEKLSDTITNIYDHVKSNAANAEMASEKAVEVGMKIQTSNSQMRDMVTAMNQITVKSTEISRIIKTIDDIAFQTNILALNAAVEAARAGQAGKGFAVVADEVRNLASKSAEAAQGTTQLIQDTIQAVEHGAKVANETAQTLASTVDATNGSVALIEEISHASREQSRAIEEVTMSVEQISSVIQNNSATSHQSAAASEKLLNQANKMKELMEKFCLKNDL